MWKKVGERMSMARVIESIEREAFNQLKVKEIGDCPSKIETSEFPENPVIVHLTEVKRYERI